MYQNNFTPSYRHCVWLCQSVSLYRNMAVCTLSVCYRVLDLVGVILCTGLCQFVIITPECCCLYTCTSVPDPVLSIFSLYPMYRTVLLCNNAPDWLDFTHVPDCARLYTCTGLRQSVFFPQDYVSLYARMQLTVQVRINVPDCVSL